MNRDMSQIRKILGFMKFFISIFLLIIIIEFVDADPGLSNPGALETHAEIAIMDDSDFTEANGVRSGSGTPEDPFVISNWLIDGNGTYGIRVRMVTKNWRIENCHIFNASNGIRAESTSVLSWIWNCEINGSIRGIEWEYGKNTTVNETLIHNVSTGLLFGKTVADVSFINSEIRDLSFWILQQSDSAERYMVNILIDNNTFSAVSGGDGMLILRQGKYVNVNITISNNTFEDVDAIVITIYGSLHNIIHNTFLDCSDSSRQAIISINSHNSTISWNHLTNKTGVPTDGIYIRGPDCTVSHNIIVNATFQGIWVTSNTFHGDNTIISNNTIWTNFTYNGAFGLGGIYISNSIGTIVEHNYIHNNTDTGILTDRYIPTAQKLVVRHNFIDNTTMHGIQIEHYTENTIVHSNILRDCFIGIVAEGNNTQVFSNIIYTSIMGISVQGIGSIHYLNSIISCNYGIVISQGGQGYQKAQSTGNNTIIRLNIINSATYGIVFMKYVAEMYPTNSTIYLNTISATNKFTFGEFDGTEFEFKLKNTYNNPYGTNNLIINSTGTNIINGLTITGNEFRIAFPWNNSNVIFIPPSIWDYSRIKILNLNNSQEISWTEGSVIFYGLADQKYKIYQRDLTGPERIQESGNILLALILAFIPILFLLRFWTKIKGEI